MSLYDLTVSFVGVPLTEPQVLLLYVVGAVIAALIIDFILSFFRRLMSF